MVGLPIYLRYAGVALQGDNAGCTIAPAAGYTLDTLTLDGKDSRVLVQGSAFTLYNLNAPHTVAGTFKRAGATSGRLRRICCCHPDSGSSKGGTAGQSVNRSIGQSVNP